MPVMFNTLQIPHAKIKRYEGAALGLNLLSQESLERLPQPASGATAASDTCLAQHEGYHSHPATLQAAASLAVLRKDCRLPELRTLDAYCWQQRSQQYPHYLTINGQSSARVCIPIPKSVLQLLIT